MFSTAAARDGDGDAMEECDGDLPASEMESDDSGVALEGVGVREVRRRQRVPGIDGPPDTAQPLLAHD